jgi:ATP phosphoribosyltransferase regulatory subunit HisZ
MLIAMTTATLLKKAISRNEGVVVLSLKEYDRLLSTHVPNYYLTGKAATDLDKLVEEGLREYAEGKTISAGSISEALAIRRKQEHKKK